MFFKHLLIIMTLAFSGCTLSQKKISSDPTCPWEENKIIAKYVTEIKIETSKEVIIDLKNSTPSQLPAFHHSYGMWIRNKWLKGKKSQGKLIDEFRRYGIKNHDDISLELIKSIHCSIRSSTSITSESFGT